jgi:predicted metalloprotease with PDZ domain
MGEAIDNVVNSPGRAFNSAVQMSQMAPFVDRSVSADRANFANTFISYYTWGQAIGLGLDLMLRERSDGRVTLDDFMRALWDKYGRPGTKMPGYVETPYTMNDLKATLAAVSGDAAFAQDFFARYIEGREVVDYAPLLARAGLMLRRRAAGRAWAGPLRTQDTQTGARVISDTLIGTPSYQAGLDRDDIIVSVGGSRTATSAEVERAIATRKPGDSLQMVYDRRGERITAVLKLVEDPSLEVVPVEEAGQKLTDVQRKFRDAWLASAARAF